MSIQNYSFLKEMTYLGCVEELWLYGSRARGDSQERSDIDIAVLCPNATEDEWQKILKIVEDSKTLLGVDCIRFDRLALQNPLRAYISKDKKILYQRTGLFMDLQLWKESFDRLGRALTRLERILLDPHLETNEGLQDGTIQRFEFVIELYWKTLKKFLAYERVQATTPKDVFRKAYQAELIHDEEVWIAMLDDRDKTSHVYEQEDARRIFLHIKESYFPVMKKTYEALQARLNEQSGD